jgi:multiple sugar transport system substrate-binding protein
MARSASRRLFLKWAIVGAATASVAPLLEACSGGAAGTATAPAQPAAPAATAARVVPGQAGGASTPSSSGAKSLTFMHESSFIPPFDKYMSDTLAPAYQQATGVQVTYDTVSVGSIQSKITAEVETNAGPDLTLLEFNWAHLYDDKLVDLTDIADDLGSRYGGWYDGIKDAVVVGGKWKAIPLGNIGQLMVYRTDWFKEVGYEKFPDTWDELLEAGTKLKEKGHPLGLTMGHGFGDNHGWMYPLLWSFGGREVDKEGKQVVLDSDETAKAVDYVRTLYEKAQLTDVLGWTDPSNNKAFLSEQISCTNNASSILSAAKTDFPQIAPSIGHALNPKGPSGERFQLLNPWTHAIFTFSSDVQASKDFMKWLNDEKQFSAWLAAGDAYYAPFLHAYDNHSMWNSEPRMQPYKESVQYSHLPGWPAAPGRATAESLAKYVISDMFAKAAQGDSTKSVISTAADQLKQIYGAS